MKSYIQFKPADAIDLNEQNVQRLFSYCLANETTDSTNVLISSFFNNETPGNIPRLKFDRTKLVKTSNCILYLLGQLRSVHNGSTDLYILAGFEKYNGTAWTQNKVALFALYYLGTAASVLPSFRFLPISNVYASPISDFRHLLSPTLSPNDPNFENQNFFE